MTMWYDYGYGYGYDYGYDYGYGYGYDYGYYYGYFTQGRGLAPWSRDPPGLPVGTLAYIPAQLP